MRTNKRRTRDDFDMDIDLEEFDYNKDLTIDKHNLDGECLRQSKLYMKYVKLTAQAKKAQAYAEERVKTIRSQLTKDFKKSNASATGPMIEAHYRTHPKYKKAKVRLIEAQFNYELLYGSIFAFQQRKSNLEDLILLWSQEYFSTPRTPAADDRMSRSERTRRRSQGRRKK